ncbi:MAG TPA: valine--tRNA ligase [Bacteroidales bacterium]|nr:valine--tRNA ligase [Bacteroidales bacterium]
MDLSSKYNPTELEERWYAHWMAKGYFHSEPDSREPYTIVIPPPNVTGVLHMGHMLNNTIQDVLIRRARMKGYNACWVPGTDHASIATEAKVVSKLKSQGIEKSQITREEFLEHAWEWTHKHGGIILEQLKKLGASCDWNRTAFTMDESLYESVIDVFIDLYNKGLIYRGVRMVNWDPQALTAVSDEEVFYKEVQSKLYYVRYMVEGEDDAITIATTRPETILGDTAVCVHPEDERYARFHGKKVIVPLVNRSVPIIIDEYVDREFGTGALKITPAHDINDYNLGLKHHLPSIDIFNDNGTLSEAAGLLVGIDRFEARKAIVPMLQDAGLLVRIEDYVNKVGYSERTDAVIEPRISLQWFLRMQAFAQQALEVVENDTIQFHPPKFKNTYRHWMENVKDWCISRQLWWGQRIPVYYLPDGGMVVARSAGEALEEARKRWPDAGYSLADLKQDEDVVDTWFSSWLWPISVFDGIRKPDNPDMQYYYPTNDLVTAPDIIFFWVARMIMAGLEYPGKIPFRNVYFTGIVRDKHGRKMSKTLGNSPDPLDLIAKYGADGVRMGMLLTAPAGNDLPFDEALCEQGRNFSNKIWNALRLVKGWKVDPAAPRTDAARAAAQWFDARFNQVLQQTGEHFDKFRLSDALMGVYKLIWDDFCSWYLEIIKPEYGQPIDPETLEITHAFFRKLMQLLHPFMPFITEEVWNHLKPTDTESDIIISQLPDVLPFDEQVLRHFEFAAELVNAIRKFRTEKNIPMRDKLSLQVKGASSDPAHVFDAVVIKLGNLDSLTPVAAAPAGALGFVVRSTECFVPVMASVNTEEERSKLLAELEYTQGFLKSVEAKLGNERFVANAPAKVIENEQKKKADALARIAVLEKQLALLDGQ